MTNQEFDQLLKKVIQTYGETYIDEYELNETPHKLSWNFKEKIKAPIRKAESQPCRTNIRMHTRLRYALIAGIAAVFLMGAGYQMFAHFCMTAFPTHIDISIASDEQTDVDMSVKYEITEGLNGYEQTSYTEDPLAYYNYCYESTKHEIYFSQTHPKYSKIMVNTEGFELEPITINGSEGFYINMFDGECKYLSWVQDGYVFTIDAASKESGTPTIGKDALIKIAESVQKVE